MSKEKMDFTKVLAMLAQTREAPAPLTNVARTRLEIPYITSKNTVERRPVKLFLPEGVQHPLPLVFVPNYEISEDSTELRAYLKNGWAVASPADLKENANGQLIADDLVFNNAALYTLRHLSQIDARRIALVGGSAGGYMTLMLHALHMGICGSIANGPITNVHFNLHQYFPKANAYNLAALARLLQEQSEKKDVQDELKTPLDLLQGLAKLPIPFIAALSGSFQPIANDFPDPDDVNRWEAFSPVALTDWFSSPLMVNHNTSDVLVPIDQITKQFTYEKPGESLPEGFDSRLPASNPGKLKYSMEELLPAEETAVERILIIDPDADGVLPFVANKRFQINIFDNGPVEGYGSHSSQIGTGRWDDVPYLANLFARGADKTNVLTQDKLRSMLERFAGKSVQLPAHLGVDDTVYGSLAVYRNEVCEELKTWIAVNGATALDKIFDNLLAMEPDEAQREELNVQINNIKTM